MGEFKRRCLYRSTNSMGINGPEMFESMWAYTIQYPGADHRPDWLGREKLSVHPAWAKQHFKKAQGIW